MKKHVNIVLIITGLVILSACDLSETIYDTPMSETFLQSQSDVQFMLNGVYAGLSSGDLFKDRGNQIYFYGADDIVGYSTRAEISDKTYTAASAGIVNKWRASYRVINNVNKLREAMENLEIDESFNSRVKGELYFLRGWMYFDLVRLFGGVPLRTEGSNGSTTVFALPRNSVEDTYNLIFDDLKKAVELCIPFSQIAVSEIGRATKGAAQGMLALAHLTYANYLDLQNNPSKAREHYELAKEFADLLIESGEYSLIPDYAHLWDVERENDAYREVILGVRFTRDPTTSGTGSRGSQFATFSMPTTLHGVTGNAPNGTGTAQLRIQPWFYDKCSTGDYEGDYRADVSFLTKWINNGVEGSYRIAYPTVRTSLTSGEQVTTEPYLNKYKDPKGFDTQNHENDLFYLRLSEIYLIKAEAENELNGPTAIAYEAFNKLRERARKANGISRTVPLDLSPGLSKEEFRMKIFDERGLELVGEGHRWFDSVRMRYSDNKRTMMEYILNEYIKSIPTGLPVFNAAQNRWDGGRVIPGGMPPWNSKYLLYPVSASEIAANPDFGPQNPGW